MGPNNKRIYLQSGIVFLLITLTYLPIFIWMIDRWMAAETYYSHGFLIPLVSIFIIFKNRGILAKMKIEPNKWGWLIFTVGLVIQIISAFLSIYFSSGFSLIFVLAGAILLFFGKDFLKRLLFPILFLVFMIPLPLFSIANLSFRLKILASQIATTLLNFIGIGAVREGSTILTKRSFLVVEDPCSGIRSLIALIALGSLMAYLSNTSKAKKAILFSSTIPIAISSNILRIVMLSLASEIYGLKLATGIFHDITGVLVFVFTFLVLLIIERILD